MLWDLETGWLLMAVAAVTVLALFFGSILHGILHEDGFGPAFNAVLFAGGFFAGILAVNEYGIALRDLASATAVGMCGAFASIASMVLAKAVVTRI